MKIKFSHDSIHTLPKILSLSQSRVLYCLLFFRGQQQILRSVLAKTCEIVES